MKTKDQISQETYGTEYKWLCGNRERTVDQLYALQKKKKKR